MNNLQYSLIVSVVKDNESMRDKISLNPTYSREIKREIYEVNDGVTKRQIEAILEKYSG